RVAEDYHARVVQHECDHLDGILYPMRMTDLTSFGYIEEMTKALDENAMDEAEAAEPEAADA
ncbi:MAG: peptide deformylase, partial [Rhodospirillales bacterium]